MTFPAVYTVKWYVYDENAQDELGNDVPQWMPAEERAVIGWKPVTTEELGEFESREITSLVMEVPPDFSFSLQDRCQLPGSTDLYEVIGGQSGGVAFHQWNPGDLLTLKLVK